MTVSVIVAAYICTAICSFGFFCSADDVDAGPFVCLGVAALWPIFSLVALGVFIHRLGEKIVR